MVGRSSHSLSGGVDSPVAPPPVRCCCIQGCVRKKTILKDGRRPAVSSWQRFWIQVSGPVLVFYSAKSLRGSVLLLFVCFFFVSLTATR